MKALVVNCSAPAYNLGARKLADWLRLEGHDVSEWGGDPGAFSFGFDVVALSVIFSWHAPIAREIALRVKASSEVWCGGPGMTELRHWWHSETGTHAHVGLDGRFDRQRGDYLMTFAARGCTEKCFFCNVWRVEGSVFSYDWDFRPAPVLCDNNLSGLSEAFQDHIIKRYIESGVPLRDANSGFEPRAFNEDTFARWEPLLSRTDAPYRYALDEQREAPDVEKVCAILSGVRSRRKQVWVLVGNESVASCYDRAMKVLSWGAEPWCQYMLPLWWLGDPKELERHPGVAKQMRETGWTYQLGRDFCRYFNRRLWRSLDIREYRPRQDEAPPFRNLFKAAA